MSKGCQGLQKCVGANAMGVSRNHAGCDIAKDSSNSTDLSRRLPYVKAIAKQKRKRKKATISTTTIIDIQDDSACGELPCAAFVELVCNEDAFDQDDNAHSFLPSKATSKRKKNHDAMVSKRHADKEREAVLTRWGDSAVTPMTFLWEIMPDTATHVRASFEDIKAHAKPNFSVTACSCVDARSITIYQGLKSDPFTAYFGCVECSHT